MNRTTNNFSCEPLPKNLYKFEFGTIDNIVDLLHLLRHSIPDSYLDSVISFVCDSHPCHHRKKDYAKLFKKAKANTYYKGDNTR